MPPGGIRTHDLSRRAAADLRLRPRGRWDRHLTQVIILIILCTFVATCCNKYNPKLYLQFYVFKQPEGDQVMVETCSRFCT